MAHWKGAVVAHWNGSSGGSLEGSSGGSLVWEQWYIIIIVGMTVVDSLNSV